MRTCQTGEVCWALWEKVSFQDNQDVKAYWRLPQISVPSNNRMQYAVISVRKTSFILPSGKSTASYFCSTLTFGQFPEFSRTNYLKSSSSYFFFFFFFWQRRLFCLRDSNLEACVSNIWFQLSSVVLAGIEEESIHNSHNVSFTLESSSG